MANPTSSPSPSAAHSLNDVDLPSLSATRVRALVLADALPLTTYIDALLTRIRQRDGTVRAWAYLDEHAARKRARELDALPPGRRGALHGVVVGVKDVFLTEGMPTRQNSEFHQEDEGDGRQDASAVGLLRAAGALILGKVTTTELGIGGTFAATTNPHDARYSCNSSSSGSAAAVADLHVPVTLGTQSVGSTIQPASCTGVLGYKLTYGLVSTEGQTTFIQSWDTLGLFARCAADLRLLLDVLDPVAAVQGPRASEIPRGPSRVVDADADADDDVVGLDLGAASFAMLRTAQWHRAGPSTIAAMEHAARILRERGARVQDIEQLPPAFDAAPDWGDDIECYEGTVALRARYARRKSGLHAVLRDDYFEGDAARAMTYAKYRVAADGMASLRPCIDAIANEYTAIIAPSSIDVASLLTEMPRPPYFNGLWTGLHVPAINIPGLVGAEGLPIGLTIVAARGRDRHLLNVAEALGKVFAGSAPLV